MTTRQARILCISLAAVCIGLVVAGYIRDLLS